MSLHWFTKKEAYSERAKNRKPRRPKEVWAKFCYGERSMSFRMGTEAAASFRRKGIKGFYLAFDDELREIVMQGEASVGDIAHSISDSGVMACKVFMEKFFTEEEILGFVGYEYPVKPVDGFDLRYKIVLSEERVVEKRKKKSTLDTVLEDEDEEARCS